MAVLANAKMWSMILQMVFLVQCHQALAAKFKRQPYSVQEMNHDFPSGGEIGSYSSFSESYAPEHGLARGYGGSGGFYASHVGGLSEFGMHDSHIGSFGPHIVSGGTSLLEHQDESHLEHHDDGNVEHQDDSHDEHHEDSHEQQEAVHSKIKAILLESELHRKEAEEKIQKMRRSFGYNTFGYSGYEYPIKTGPIDLGTYKAIDLGTTLDHDSIKDSHGKLKLPVQTVYITKTVGVPIPEPFPIKHEVPVPAPYPVPVPTHYSNDHYSESYSADDLGDSGKSSYHGSESTLSKVVSYPENLPKSTEKHYASASTNYARYLPRPSSSAFRSALTPTHYASKQSVYEFK